MNDVRPRASLGRVLDDLGATLLELVEGDLGRAEEIGGIAIHDPMDEPLLPAHALVLGIGLQDADYVASLLLRLGRQGAVGLVVRAPFAADLRVAAAVRESGVALLGLTPGAGWAQLAAMLRSVLAGDLGGLGAESTSGPPSGDLFSLANAVAALLDAPVTIEDRSSRVLAFSGRQDEADATRVETILGRQVPEAISRVFVERGVFRELYRSTDPVYVDSLPTSLDAASLPRVAVAVRAGDEVLGSIWVAVRGPLNEERKQSLCDAAKLVALHLLRLHAGADVERRMRADLLSSALAGGRGAPEALDRLGLGDQPIVVLALAMLQKVDRVPPREGDAGLALERQRISDSFAMHLGAVQPRCAVALLGDTAYALFPVSQGDNQGEDRAAAVGADFLRRLGDRINAVIGVGPVAHGAAELAAARSSADRVLRVLRSGNANGQRVARLADVHVEALILELCDLAASRGEQPTGQIARLYAYDEKHNANLVDTLRAWLDAFGDVAAASAAVYIHPNTFRYRLRRLALVGGLDLDDPKTRFAAMLQLCILASRSA
ncbi:PucR family transcriptional regulator [Paenarthrobacter nitroguajacolicus]|uniref:PucR family transcriptional regulator n=1 Tax=Paenarthrobacter nitroguajacolicus TaxID=211146 RepID=A0A558GVI5_PAENT|nr:PucR family transcriptional regulator [Paenarthrobacter nitroguajacolicus]TVU60890.1 PucR family transcriptional regulator [Paenarthrobacter nitroguajacolicus]